MLRKLITYASAAALAGGVLLAGSAPAQAYTVTDCFMLSDGTSMQYVKHTWFEKNMLGKRDGWQHKQTSCYI